MSPSKKMSRTAIIALTAISLPAFGLSASSAAFAETTCPTGWTHDSEKLAIDGIFCDRLETTAGSFTVPEGIDEISVTAIAGGGGGGGGGETTILVAGGGGGAGELAQDLIDVVAGDVINYTAGGGGAAGANVSGGVAISGGNGGDSTVSIGGNAAIVIAQGGRGGVNGEDGGNGGAAGGTDAYDGGDGSSANPAAGGGGGGLFSDGVDGTEGAVEKGGNGGTGYGVQEYPHIGHDVHSLFPEYETMNWNTNGNPDVYFLDRMSYGGGGGVVLDEGISCSGDSHEFYGFSIPGEVAPINQLGQGACATQGVPNYAGGLAVTAIHAGTGGSGSAGTGTDSYSQPTAGYEGFVYFRIFVAEEAGAGGGGGEPIAQTGPSEIFGNPLGLVGGIVLIVGMAVRFMKRRNRLV